ncbi:hypothetical protein Ade02nite_17680 [Paractinoplanes deccanensis]|uniref:CobE/GbiG C-terminal domain-containing protein n=1 Tax=Paractinoplanes deccanensis TaxID=113561 RepID=A0ABQ3XZF2_9ACTN|nr:cobalamin biosynthesis protein [Actinoplanes deccanensis]GID73127.1 hypothetical protein Ade02nite_17680 [Actinoplanes deccanensis]
MVGVGARPGTAEADIRSAVDEALAAAGLDGAQVGVLATIDRRAEEPGLRGLAAERGWRLAGLPAAELAARDVPNGNGTVAAAVGTPSVAEAAAMAAAGGGATLVLPKKVFHRVTVAIARKHRDA